MLVPKGSILRSPWRQARAQMGPNSGTKRVFFSFGTVWRIDSGVLHGPVPHFVPFSLTPVASAMSLGAIWLAQDAILMSLFVRLT